jgi:hypothetical protein
MVTALLRSIYLIFRQFLLQFQFLITGLKFRNLPAQAGGIAMTQELNLLGHESPVPPELAIFIESLT